MPQMAPINWLSLFIIFFFTLLLFSCMNYFSFNINKNKENKSKLMTNKYFMNWKW